MSQTTNPGPDFSPPPQDDLPASIRPGGPVARAVEAGAYLPPTVSGGEHLRITLRGCLDRLRSDYKYLLSTRNPRRVDTPADALRRAMDSVDWAHDPVFLYAVAAAERLDIGPYFNTAFDAYIRRPDAYDALLDNAIPEDFVRRADHALAVQAFHAGTNPTALEDWNTYVAMQAPRRSATRLGLPTGLPRLDELTGGVKGMTLVIGETGVGKSAFAAEVSLAALAAIPDLGVVYFSLDMPKVQLIDRLRCRVAQVGYRPLKTGTLTPREEETLVEADRRLGEQVMPRLSIQEWGYHQRDNRGTAKERVLTADAMADVIRTFRQASRVDQVLVVIDLLGRMRVSHDRTADAEADEKRVEVLLELRDRFRAGSNSGGFPFLVLAEVRKDRRGRELEEDDVRGSVRIPYSVDSILTIEPDDSRVPADGQSPCLIRSIKAREGVEKGRVPATFHFRTYEFTEAAGPVRTGPIPPPPHGAANLRPFSGR